MDPHKHPQNVTCAGTRMCPGRGPSAPLHSQRSLENPRVHECRAKSHRGPGFRRRGHSSLPLCYYRTVGASLVLSCLNCVYTQGGGRRYCPHSAADSSRPAPLPTGPAASPSHPMLGALPSPLFHGSTLHTSTQSTILRTKSDNIYGKTHRRSKIVSIGTLQWLSP